MLIYFLKLPLPYLRQCARTSGEIFGTRTSGDLICVGKNFDGLFCSQIPPVLTYILYVLPLQDLVCTPLTYMVYFVYLFLGSLILWLGALTSGDLFCTYTYSCWPIQYTRMFMKAYSVHIIFFIFDLFCTSTTCSWLYTLVNLGPSLVSLSVRMHPAGWLILYIRNFSTAYSVHIRPHVGINSVSTTSSWPSLYTSELILIRYLTTICSYLWRPIRYNYLL